MFGGAGVAAWLTLLFLSLALMFALANAMDVGWAALIVAVLWAVVAAVLAALGRSRLRQATPPLQQTKETLKEDAQWAKRQSS
jgi:membrane protein implicated in regulation of membrane protease activity